MSHTSPKTLSRRKRFTISTDHDAHKWVLNVPDWTGRLVRWRLRLSKFDFEVVYRAGVKNQDVEASQRLETDGTDERLLEDDIPELVLSLVQQIDPHDDEKERSLADKDCVCGGYDVSAGKLQNNLATVAAIVLAKATHISKN